MEKTSLVFSLLALIISLIFLFRKNKNSSSYNTYEEEEEFDFKSAEQKHTEPSPYCLIINNKTTDIKNCFLFGLGQFIHAKNYGSDEGLNVAMQTSNVSYIELLMQSGFMPFETKLIRLRSKSREQISQIIFITSKDANGQMCEIPLIVQSYMKNIEPNYDGYYIVDVPYCAKIDLRSNIRLNILPETELFIHIYKKNRVDVFDKFYTINRNVF